MWYTDNVVLMTLGGSHAYGLATDTSDVDERGVAFPPLEWLVGFPPDKDGKQTHDQRHVTSEDGIREDRDLVVHTLAKFCRLALNANPNILDILFCRDEEVLLQTVVGTELRSFRDRFLSCRAYTSYSGYAAAQLKRMRNHNTDHGSRQELVERYGYDPKNAMHLIRLLRMGKTLLQDGRVEVYRSDRDELLKIRSGAYTASQIQSMAEELDQECRQLRDHSVLPERPDREGIERWLVEVQTAWAAGDRSLLFLE